VLSRSDSNQSTDSTDLTERLAVTGHVVSSSGLSRTDIESLYALYCLPVIRNYGILIEGTKFIFEMLENGSLVSGDDTAANTDSDSLTSRDRKKSAASTNEDDEYSFSSGVGINRSTAGPRHSSFLTQDVDSDGCYLVTHEEAILESMLTAPGLHDVSACFENINIMIIYFLECIMNAHMLL
jgi:hypothetical protein